MHNIPMICLLYIAECAEAFFETNFDDNVITAALQDAVWYFRDSDIVFCVRALQVPHGLGAHHNKFILIRI